MTTEILIMYRIILFAAQRFGTSKVGKFFGPIMVLWFITLSGLGIYHISTMPSIDTIKENTVTLKLPRYF